MIIVKYILEFLWSCLLWAVWGQFSFRCSLFQLDFFSRSISPFPCLVNVKDGVLICYTCHSQSGSLFFVLASSVCKPLQCVISPLTQGAGGGHLFMLTCSVVLWGGRDTANKYHWHVWGVLTVDGPHWVCHNPGWHIGTGCTLLSLQSALQQHCPKWPCISCTSQV